MHSTQSNHHTKNKEISHRHHASPRLHETARHAPNATRRKRLRPSSQAHTALLLTCLSCLMLSSLSVSLRATVQHTDTCTVKPPSSCLATPCAAEIRSSHAQVHKTQFQSCYKLLPPVKIRIWAGYRDAHRLDTQQQPSVPAA